MKKLFNSFYLLALFVLPTLVIIGCKHGTLASGGAYAPGYYATNADSTISTNFTATGAPDFAFFAADEAYALAFATVDGAFQYEQKNRAALWKLSPDIKHTLDKLRPQAWTIHQQWAVARQAYLANPIPANLAPLQKLLAQIQAVTASVAAAVATPTSTAK